MPSHKPDTPVTADAAAQTSTAAVTALSDDGTDPARSLQELLHWWTVANPQLASASPLRECTFLSRFPRPLDTPLPRSFRPCEMLPGLYLGSIDDIGTDASALIQRLAQATTGAAMAPQQMALLVRACPLPGVAEPQLELHVARARKSGTRRGSACVGAAQRPTKVAAASSQRPRGAAGVPGEQVLACVHDVEVMQLSLTKLHAMVCAAVYDSSSADSLSSTMVEWLRPSIPASLLPTASALPTTCGGAPPLDFTSAGWDALVEATQEVLLDDYAQRTDNVPASWGEVYCYWRLVLPILDRPSVAIQQYFSMTTLVIHAALSLSTHPKWGQWSSGGGGVANAPDGDAAQRCKEPIECGEERRERDGKAAAAAATPTQEYSASAQVGLSASTMPTPRTVPCVVVHCLAGKSRSVSFVTAFILQEWMMWYGTLRPSASPITASLPSTEAPDADPTAQQMSSAHGGVCKTDTASLFSSHSNATRALLSCTKPGRLVDIVMTHLRSRRLCVGVNLGFDAQLLAMVKAFMSSLCV